MTMDIKVNRMNKIDNPEKNLRAFADIEVNESILIKGLQVMNGKNGIFVSMPRQKGKDNRWYESVRTLNAETKDRISEAVLTVYRTSCESLGQDGDEKIMNERKVSDVYASSNEDAGAEA